MQGCASFAYPVAGLRSAICGESEILSYGVVIQGRVFASDRQADGQTELLVLRSHRIQTKKKIQAEKTTRRSLIKNFRNCN